MIGKYLVFLMPKTKIELTIIIVSYNTREVIERCVKSLSAGLGDWVKKTKLILVDNGSSDGSAEWLTEFAIQNQPYRVSLIKNKTNLGFGRAVNFGYQQAEGDWLLLLNSDIVCQPGSIEKLIEWSRKKTSVGVIGGRLLNLDHSPQASVYHLPTIGRAIEEFWLDKKGAFSKYLPKKSGEVEAVVGAVMLLPIEAVKRDGLFQKKYFMYFEDLDLCRRYRQKGLKVYYCEEAEFLHYHGESTKKAPQKANRYLVESSLIYHGLIKKSLIDGIIWLSYQWKKIKRTTGR